MAVVVLPDIEAALTSVLRASPDVQAIVGDRVYTTVPNSPTWPLVVLKRTGGEPLVNTPLWVDRAYIELSAYGGPKSTARLLVDTCRGVLAETRGVHNSAVINWIRFGAMLWVPDNGFTPARPRYLADLVVTYHRTP